MNDLLAKRHGQPLPLAIPFLGEEEERAVARVVASGWLTQGERVREFEERFAVATGAAHACAVSSGTAALHLALLAVGVLPGDVVITVSHSFIATASAVRQAGAEPVFVDIDEETGNVDPQAVRRALADDFLPRGDALFYRYVDRLAVNESPLCRTTGARGRLACLLVVHQVGMSVDLSAILPLARSYALPIVEDAACAAGSEVSLDGGRSWERIGKPHGNVACFSFHPRKVITTGEGGMLTCDSEEIDRAFRLLRHHGMSVSDLERHRSEQPLDERYVRSGFNYRMTDLQAAIGVVQLARLPEIVRRRRALAARYAEALRSVPGVRAPAEPPYARSNWQSYVVRLRSGAERERVRRMLAADGISSRPGVMCAHLEPSYAQQWRGVSLPKSEVARETGLMLPLYPAMEPTDVDRVVGVLERAICGSGKSACERGGRAPRRRLFRDDG